MSAVCGHSPVSGLYYELVGQRSSGRRYLLIHGGGATGACFRATPDGRLGWADLLAARGAECWVTDWPGCGRSGRSDPLGLHYEDLVAGYLELLEGTIQEPVVIVCHSMGGVIAWKLAERAPALVEEVVALAASHPGNGAPRSQVIEDDGTLVRALFAASGVEFRIRRDRLYHYDDAYVLDQGIASSTRFPRDCLAAFRAGLCGIPPLVLLQRLGLEGGLPSVTATESFSGLPVRLVAGPEDPAHTREIEQATAALLASWGARVETVFLDDAGVRGNGHFFFLEENSDELLDLALPGWST